jgi:hypothetical protein
MIYISGAITDTNNYLERFDNAVAVLYAQDSQRKIINPANLCDTLPPLEHEQYMTICMAALSLCDSIYLLKGWENSKGAKMEVAYAIKNDLTILCELT